MLTICSFHCLWPERQTLLESKLQFERYDVRNFLEIIPTARCRNTMRNFKMKFSNGGLGGFVGIEVVEESGGFRPKIELDQDLSLTFFLRIKDPNVWTFSQANLRREAPYIYYFTNQNPNSDKNFPSLSTPVSTFQPGRFYEMGELANVGGVIRTARERTNSNAIGNWDEVNLDGYVNEDDRVLISKRFAYRFADPTGITSATFSIVDENATNVKTIDFTGITNPGSPFALDFSTIPDPLDATRNLPVQDGQYTLEVSADNGFSESRQLFMYDEWYRKDFLGVMDIHVDVSDNDFNLLDSGLLKDPHPVFEIRFKNRLTYLRYNKRTDFTQDEIDATDSFLDEDNSMQMTTIDPRSPHRWTHYFRKPAFAFT